jgi:asparagine synthase (glutamine-hydrolysing)
MPGITGIVSKNPEKINGPSIQLMTKCIDYESFYNSGIYVKQEIGICVGWSNKNGSYSDCMPVFNENNDLILVFYGEHFADKKSIDNLKRENHNFNPNDASYLIHLYEENKEDFFSILNGWFSGILIDINRGVAFLFNDRFGMQKLYYYEGKDILYFASEAKALIEICPELRELNIESLAEFFSLGCTLEENTLFSRINLLPPGSLWKFRKGSISKKTFFFRSETWENQPILGKDLFYRKFKKTFNNILPRYFTTNTNIALSLTGGLDTRMILASTDIPYNTLPCYTFGGMYNECYDVRIAKKIAKLCGQTHKVITVGDEFLAQFPNLAERSVFITDGSMDVSGAVDLYLNRIAKNISNTRLTGNYGSEVLRGAMHLKASLPLKGLFNRDFEKLVFEAENKLIEQSQGNRVSFAAFKQTHWNLSNKLSLEQSQLNLRSPYLDNDLISLIFQAPEAILNSSEFSFRLIKDGNRRLGEIATDRGLNGRKGDIISKILHFYYEFLFKADYAFNYGMPQWLTKFDHYLFAPFGLEKIFLGRHKLHHFRIWYRDELADYVKDILLDKKSLNRSYLNSYFVENMVSDHTTGKSNYTTEITKLISMELFQRLFID